MEHRRRGLELPDFGGSVSRTTDCVIAGPGAASRLDDAKSPGVRVFTEAEFVEMLEAKPLEANQRQDELF